jgi:hypothetical protein
MLLFNETLKIGIIRIVGMIGASKPYKKLCRIDKSQGYNKELCGMAECSVAKIMKGNITEEQKNLITYNFCSKCPYHNKEIVIYKNEANDLKIDKEMCSSRSQILQFLMYHILCDSNGIVRSISDEEIAAKLGVTIKTVQNNNRYFISNNLICKSLKRVRNAYGVYIVDYKSYFKSKENYGRGYLQISDVVFTELLKIKPINELRLAIRELIYNNRVNPYYDENVNEFFISRDEIKSFLPDYLNSFNKIEEIIENSTFRVFYKEKVNRGYIFKIKPSYDGNAIRAAKTAKYETTIVSHILSAGKKNYKCDPFMVTDLENYISDFVQMSHQYDLDMVLRAIDQLLVFIFRTEYKGNYGGFIRNKIEEFIDDFYEVV